MNKLLKKRIWDRLMRNSFVNRNGCYIYTGPTSGREGSTLYGKISMRLPGRQNPTGVATHVLSFNTFVRTLREGYECGHQCHQGLCWNPEHLREEKHTTNMRHVARRWKEGVYAKG